MPALIADIAAGTRPAQIESWQDAAVKARYPNARDGSKDAAEGFFDDAANAITAITARGALLGTERRRFRVLVDELWWPNPAAGIPTVTLIDPEQSVNAAGLVSRVEVNLEAESTLFEVFI